MLIVSAFVISSLPESTIGFSEPSLLASGIPTPVQQGIHSQASLVPLVPLPTIMKAPPLPKKSSTNSKLYGSKDDAVVVPTKNASQAIGYRIVSLLHLLQCGMAIRKSGLTLTCLHSMVGPLLVTGITAGMLVAVSKDGPVVVGRDSFQRLNGLLVLYAALTLGMVGMLPQQLSHLFGKLWLLSGLSTLWVAVAAYLATIRNEQGRNTTTTFASDTARLLKEASNISRALPPHQISWGDFASLGSIAIQKVIILYNMIWLLATSNSNNNKIKPLLAIQLSQLTRLTIIGGTLVTIISADKEHHPVAKHALFYMNLFTSYAFFTMSALAFSVASPVDFAKSLVFAFCAISSAVKGFRSWRHFRMNPNKPSKKN